MIRIAIVDDERIFAENLKRKVDTIFQKQKFQFQSFLYTDPHLFAAVHNQNKFQLIFLDIDMPEISGMEIASKIRAYESKTVLIFVSSHSNFVYETFQFRPFRFIRKEKLAEELPEAINSYCDELSKNKNIHKFELENKKYVMEDLEKVIYFFSVRHDIYYTVISGETKMLSPRVYTMEKIEELLQQQGFLRIHKTYIVNYKYIYQIHSNYIELTIKTKDNEDLPVSHRRLADIRKQYHILMRGGDDI